MGVFTEKTVLRLAERREFSWFVRVLSTCSFVFSKTLGIWLSRKPEGNPLHSANLKIIFSVNTPIACRSFQEQGRYIAGGTKTGKN